MPPPDVSIWGAPSPGRGTFLGVFLPGVVSVTHIPQPPPPEGTWDQAYPWKGPVTRDAHPQEGTWD